MAVGAVPTTVRQSGSTLLSVIANTFMVALMILGIVGALRAVVAPRALFRALFLAPRPLVVSL